VLQIVRGAIGAQERTLEHRSVMALSAVLTLVAHGARGRAYCGTGRACTDRQGHGYSGLVSGLTSAVREPRSWFLRANAAERERTRSSNWPAARGPRAERSGWGRDDLVSSSGLRGHRARRGICPGFAIFSTCRFWDRPGGRQRAARPGDADDEYRPRMSLPFKLLPVRWAVDGWGCSAGPW